ncbi:15220_t:CDS:2, partial [Gigaspora margarita]
MPSEKKKCLPLPEGLDFTTRPKDSLVDDLRYALEHARELYADIAWEFTLALTPTTIFAHKAILYARSSRSFQERFLKNKDANGMSIKSVRLSNADPVTVKTDADPFLFRQELKFFYTAEEGSEDFLQAVDTTDELEQDKLKDDLLYMLKSKLYTDVEAHRFMLSSRSEYFKKMLSSDFIEAHKSSIRLDASIFNPTSINLILTFIYTGNLSSSSKPLTLETCEWVWIGADFLNIKNLCDECIYRIATKVHFFTCTCGECQIVVPRVAAFAKEHDVDKLWQGCLHALSHGFDSMWPNKEFANLDEDTREEILMILLANIQKNNVIATFKGCRNIVSVIDIKGIGLPWIETVRRMTNEVRSYAAKILVDNFEQICDEDQEFLNCVDGVGFSSDILEDIMNIVVEESLTEQNSARILKCITGKLLTRPAVLSAENVEAKRLLTQSKQNVFNYMKKRWLGVKQYGGFRLLSPWLLDEFVK